MVRRQRGMISVDSRKFITDCIHYHWSGCGMVRASLLRLQLKQGNEMSRTVESSCFTRAPMTPKAVSLKYSKGRVFEVVLRKGYRNNGIWACKNSSRVSEWDATHWKRANALQTRFDVWVFNSGGCSCGYISVISCKHEVEHHRQVRRGCHVERGLRRDVPVEGQPSFRSCSIGTEQAQGTSLAVC